MFGNEPGDSTLKESKRGRTMTALQEAGGDLNKTLVIPNYDNPLAAL